MAVKEEYTLEEAAALIEKTIARKNSEIVKLEEAGKKIKAKKKKEDNEELVKYLKAEVISYITVLADMKDDESLVEGLDPNTIEAVECPAAFEQYMESLSDADREEELEADAVRSDYCDQIVEDMCFEIGESALTSKKMIESMLEDPYALEAIGEIIFYDDVLYNRLSEILDKKDDKKDKKSKKKDKKKSKKD